MMQLGCNGDVNGDINGEVDQQQLGKTIVNFGKTPRKHCKLPELNRDIGDVMVQYIMRCTGDIMHV